MVFVFAMVLSQFTGDRDWPFLHELALGNILMTEEALIKFLPGHATTLRILSLGEISLVEGTWNSVLSRIRDGLQLQDFPSFGRMDPGFQCLGCVDVCGV